MKGIKIRWDLPERFKADIICLIKVMNAGKVEKIIYWKKCVNRNIDEALKLELITNEEADNLRKYYELEEIKTSESA